MVFCSPPQPRWDITIYPPSEPNVLAGTHSFFQSMWDPPKSTSLWGLVSLLAHRLVSTPLRRTARRLVHRPVSGSDTICNDSAPPLADIVLFRLFFRASPQCFKTRLLGKGFHTGILFSSPNQCGTSHLRSPTHMHDLSTQRFLNLSVLTQL